MSENLSNNDMGEYVQSLYKVAFFENEKGEISLVGEDGTLYFKKFSSIEEAKSHLKIKKQHHSEFMIGKSDISTDNGMYSIDWEEKDFLANVVKSEMVIQKNDEIVYDFLKPKENNKIINLIKSKADYDHLDFIENSIYNLKDWNIEKNDIDPKTDKVISSKKLSLIHSDHSDNYNYLNGVKFNLRIFYDKDENTYLALVHLHLGGDVRGNYDDPIIFEEDEYETLLQRLQGDIIDFHAMCLIQFTDGSIVVMDAYNIKKNFNFSISNYDLQENTIANKFNSHIESMDQINIDKLVHNCFNTYKKSIRYNSGTTTINYSDPEVLVSIPDEYIKDETKENNKWFNVGICLDGDDVVSDINTWIEEVIGSGSPYNISGHRGFGKRYVNKDMAESDFDALINAYTEYKESKYPLSVIECYMKENDISTHEEAIKDMKLSFVGSFNNIGELGKKWVRENKIKPNFEEIKILSTKSVANADSDLYIKKADFKKMLRYTGMDSKYNSEYKSISDQIEILEERKSIFDEELKVLSGDDYSLILDMVTDIDLEIKEKKEQLHLLPHKMSEDVTSSARKKRYDEIDQMIKNDLDSFLAQYGYDDMTQLDFIQLDYVSIGNRIMDNHYAIQTKANDNSKLYIFYVKNDDQKRKNIEIGKPNEYPNYIMEMTTKKLVSGHSNKESAEKNRKELIEKYNNLRFSVYPISTVKKKYKLDTKDYSSYVKLSNLKYSNVVSCKKVLGTVVKPNIPKWFFKKSFNDIKSDQYDEMLEDGDQIVAITDEFLKVQTENDYICYIDIQTGERRSILVEE